MFIPTVRNPNVKIDFESGCVQNAELFINSTGKVYVRVRRDVNLLLERFIFMEFHKKTR